MLTINLCNLFRYSTIQKRDFGTRVIDVICQKRIAGVPFKAKKGDGYPV